MKIDILSIFPNMFEGFLNESIIKRAREKGIVDIKIHDFRLFSKDPHKKVDDYQFGGGKGMILMPEPIYDCVESIKTEDSYVILMTPQGEKYNQKKANELKNHKHLIIICGHYEGFDERIRALADIELSISGTAIRAISRGWLIIFIPWNENIIIKVSKSPTIVYLSKDGINTLFK